MMMDLREKIYKGYQREKVRKRRKVKRKGIINEC